MLDYPSVRRMQTQKDGAVEGSFSFYAGPEELTGQVSTTIRVVAGEDRVELPTGAFLGAGFARAGFDLLLDAGSDGSVVIPDYFLRLSPPDLVTADGAVLPHHIVRALAGPMNPGQVAQAFPLGGNPGASLGLGEPIGSVSESQGAVSVLHPDGTQVMLETGDAIFQGDVIETGPDGSVNVIFVDDTVFSLDVNGRMVMDEMVYDPGSETGTFNTMVVQGVFSFVSGKVAKTSPDGMVVNTPTATIGIRGSTVLGNAAAEGAENKITLVRDVDGNVGEIVISNGAGSLVLNQAGASTTVFSASANPSPIQILSQSQIQTSFGGSLTKLVKTVAKQAEQKAEAAQTAAADAKDAAATAKADADAAKADADTQKAEADQAAEDAAAALADAQESGDPEAIATAEAAAAAAAEAQAKAAAAADAAAQAEAAAAAAAAAAAQAAAQAEQAAAFSSLASTAVDVQVSAETAAAQDNAAEQSQTSTTSTSGTAGTANTSDTADTATEGDAPVGDTTTVGDTTFTQNEFDELDQFLWEDQPIEDLLLGAQDGVGTNDGFNFIPGTAGDDTFLPGDDTDDTPIQTPVSTVNTPPAILGVVEERSVLQFDGVDDYVEISDAYYNNLSTGTVEVWLYVPDFNSSNIVLGKQDDFVNTMGVLGLGGSGGSAATSAVDGVVTWHGNNTGGTAASTGTIAAGTWQHVAVTFSNTQVSFYINGVLDSTVMGDYSIPNDVSGTVRTTLGSLISSGTPTEAFGGMMTELRIWGVERSAAEIANTYSSPLTSPDTEANLIGYWPLDTVATGGAFDLSANADDGQLGDGTSGDASEPLEVSTVMDETGASIAVSEDNSFNGVIVASDIDNDTITYGVDSGPANGTVTVNVDDGTFTYTPAADFYGTDTFTVYAEDDNGGYKTFGVTAVVSNVNDAPTVTMSTNGGVDGALDLTNTYNFSALQTNFKGKDSKVVDIDGDGDLDIVINGGEDVNTTGAWHTYVGLNDGAGNFTYTASLSGIFDDGQSVLARMDVGDVNGDGKIDMVGINAVNGLQAVYLGDGAGGLTSTGQTFNFIGGNAGGNNIKLSDLDNDGDLDIYAAIDTGGKVYLNDGNGTFTDTGTPLYNANVLSYRGTAIGDVNGDGNKDILSGSWGGELNTYSLWIGDGTGGFAFASAFGGSASAGNGLDLGDVDGDGDLDLVSFNRYSENKVYLNDGSGNFTLGAVFGSTGPARQEGLLQDMDGDGDLDVLVTGDGTLEYYANDGSGNFTYTGIGLGTSWLRDISAGDFDGDGDIDVLAVDLGTGSQILTNDTLRYADTITRGGSITFSSTHLNASDVDGDALTYSVTAIPTNGTLKLNGSTLAVNGTFTQDDVSAGNLVYEHNGLNLTLDGFTFTVSDGTTSTAPQTLNLLVEEPSGGVTGTVNDDILGTTVADDVIDGGTGNDSVNFVGNMSGYTFDFINATTLNLVDTVGGDGSDTITGVESLVFKDATILVGSNSLTGGATNDTITFSSAQSGLSIDLADGTDTVNLANGANTITLTNVETVNGGTGVDDITINGSTPSVVVGGAGADVLTGGTGSDTFTYTTVTDSTFGAMDSITNFVAGGSGDKIDTNISGTLSVVGNQNTMDTFANLTLSSLNVLANSTDGTLSTTLTGDATNTQVLQLSTTDSKTVWAIDVDANGIFDSADTVIDVTNVTGTINAADFV